MNQNKNLFLGILLPEIVDSVVCSQVFFVLLINIFNVPERIRTNEKVAKYKHGYT